MCAESRFPSSVSIMIMGTTDLCFVLLCVCNGWILSLASSCDWRTQYENNGTCCQVCPFGQYPEKHCSKNNLNSVCRQCPTDGVLDNWKCFCENESLCSNNKCSLCAARQKCKAGYQMERVGHFDYTYTCQPCPEKMYNDVEDGICKPIATCDGFKVVFAGNRTHNARCDIYAENQNKEQTNDQSNINMVYGLAIVVFLCLALVIYAAFQRYQHKRDKKLLQPCKHRAGLPLDSCTCKLSKEEMGDETDSKLTSEFSCNSSSIP